MMHRCIPGVACFLGKVFLFFCNVKLTTIQRGLDANSEYDVNYHL